MPHLSKTARVYRAIVGRRRIGTRLGLRPLDPGGFVLFSALFGPGPLALLIQLDVLGPDPLPALFTLLAPAARGQLDVDAPARFLVRVEPSATAAVLLVLIRLVAPLGLRVEDRMVVQLQTRLHLVVPVKLDKCKSLALARRLVRRQPHRARRQLHKVFLHLRRRGREGQVTDEDDEARRRCRCARLVGLAGGTGFFCGCGGFVFGSFLFFHLLFLALLGRSGICLCVSVILLLSILRLGFSLLG